MTSFIERKVNEFCGRWLEGFTKDNVDVSLLQAKITLSDVYFKTDELCLLSPTFAPSFFHVGKLLLDIPLAFRLGKPVKITVSDVLAVLRVGGHHDLTPEDMRKVICANIHIKALLSKLTTELGGGNDDEEQRPPTIGVKTVAAIHRILQNIEINVLGAHIRLEEPARRGLSGSGVEPSPRGSAVAFGLCLREISLLPDTPVEGGTGSGPPGERWFGSKFRQMETSLLGNISHYDGLDDTAGNEWTASADEMDASHKASRAPTLPLAKFASVRGLSIYFCPDQECYSATDREATLRSMKEGLRTPPAALPPLLRRCRFGLGLKVILSAAEWGKIESVDVRLLGGDVNVQITDDHLGYLLRWAGLLNNYMRVLALSALRPTPSSVHAGSSTRGSGKGSRSRYIRALWRHVFEVVLRDLRSSIRRRGREALQNLRSSQGFPNEGAALAARFAEAEYGDIRGLLWRRWFGEWVRAARYLALRQLLHPRLVVERFSDEAGGTHDKLHEDLELEPLPSFAAQNGTSERKLAKYLMPWQLPQQHVDKAWSLIGRKSVRWDRRSKGGVKLAADEERADVEQLTPEVWQAMWSIQLQMDAELPHRICAIVRCMAALRVESRTRLDGHWRARAEKQRRLGLGLGLGLDDPPPTPSLSTQGSGVTSFSASENEAGVSRETGGVNKGFVDEGDGDGADRVGTLLVRMGQLNGIGGVGLLSLAPKAIATLTLEESSASLEAMDMEVKFTRVAKYDVRNERCTWDETFRLQVELDEVYVQHLRKERARKRRSSSSLDKAVLSSSNVGLSVKANSGRPDAGSDVRMDSNDTAPLQVSEASACSSFLLSVSCADKGVLGGKAQFGKTTLPGKKLTAVSLKVMEHKCALFSPAAVGRHPRELTLQTIFVPPGQDVALAEQELSAVGKRTRLQSKLEADKVRRAVDASARKSSIRGTRTKDRPPMVTAPNTPVELQRPMYDSVGEHQVKVLSVAPDEDTAADLSNSSGLAALPNQGRTVLSNGEQRRPSKSHCIPIVNPAVPEEIAVSMRVPGVKVATYLNSSAGVVRAGSEEADKVVSLTEASASEIAVCARVDLPNGKVGAIVEATTIELSDRSLLRGTSDSRSFGGRRRRGSVHSPQLMKVGPVRCEIGAAYPAEAKEDKPTCGAAAAASTSTSESEGNQRDTGTYSSSVDGSLAGWESLLKWDWRSKLTLGAYTAELGKWREHSLADEVWRHFRFVMPNRMFESALVDTQVLRGGSAHPLAAAESSTWLMRAGRTGLKLDIQIPIDDSKDARGATPAQSPTSYVYVSSSDSNSDSPTRSRASNRAQRLSPHQTASVPAHQRVSSFHHRPPNEDDFGRSNFVDASRGSLSIGSVPMVGDLSMEENSVHTVALGESEAQGSPRMNSNAALLRRVRELEEEVATLRAASDVAATNLATTAADVTRHNA